MSLPGGVHPRRWRGIAHCALPPAVCYFIYSSSCHSHPLSVFKCLHSPRSCSADIYPLDVHCKSSKCLISGAHLRATFFVTPQMSDFWRAHARHVFRDTSNVRFLARTCAPRFSRHLQCPHSGASLRVTFFVTPPMSASWRAPTRPVAVSAWLYFRRNRPVAANVFLSAPTGSSLRVYFLSPALPGSSLCAFVY